MAEQRRQSTAVVGSRVILAEASDRTPDVLGTVIESDPYSDRDAIVRVGFENGVARWVHRGALRCLSQPSGDDDACVLAEWEAEHGA